MAGREEIRLATNVGFAEQPDSSPWRGRKDKLGLAGVETDFDLGAGFESREFTDLHQPAYRHDGRSAVGELDLELEVHFGDLLGIGADDDFLGQNLSSSRLGVS